MSKVIQNNKLDFLHLGRLQQKEAITVRISKILVESKIFLPAANLHGDELKVLVKICTTGRKFYKNSPRKLTILLLKIFITIFSF